MEEGDRFVVDNCCKIKLLFFIRAIPLQEQTSTIFQSFTHRSSFRFLFLFLKKKQRTLSLNIEGFVNYNSLNGV